MQNEKSLFKKKTGIAIICIVLLLITAIVIPVTYAYLKDNSAEKSNTFEVGNIDIEVEETFDEETQVKTNVSVKNNGNFPAFIRVALVINWMDNVDSEAVVSAHPVSESDYSLDLNLEDWFLHDGYYYHKAVVQPEENSAVLINELKMLTSAQNTSGIDLSFETQIIASGIQYVPAELVEQAWPVTVSDGGISIDAKNTP